MKVYVNWKPKYTPWGGGIKTINLLVEKLTALGHEVTHKLDKDTTVIFQLDPRPNDYGENYRTTIHHARKYNIPIIQRVGDLGLHGKPALTDMVKTLAQYAHKVIFISQFAEDKFKEWGVKYKDGEVISLAPMASFYEYRKEDTTIDDITIVTHHWSPNLLKGWAYYEYLDGHLPANMKMTYIGQLPPGKSFKNVEYIKPVKADALSLMIPKHKIYISGTVGETGGNHVLEAMACGLPVIYHTNSGGPASYCADYGLSFTTNEELVQRITQVAEDYATFKKKVLSYTDTMEDMIDKYVDLILKARD